MKLNRENYGIFIIDYFDGNLSKTESEQLLLFLDANPDLKKEFRDLEKVSLSKPEVAFPDKEKLKIPAINSAGPINGDNYESFFVLYHDGELKEVENKELKRFLDNNPHLLKDLELFRRARIEKDPKVVFQNKAALKHKQPVTIRLAFTMAAAAMLLIYFGFRFLMPPETKTQAPPQYTRIAALEVMPAMTVSATLSSDETLRLKSQHKVEVPKTRPVIIQQIPIGTLASLDAPTHFENVKNHALLYASRSNRRNTAERPHPVVVEETHNSFFASALTRPIDKIAGLFAKRKREKKENNEHNKPFVQLLEGGVNTFNFLTNNDVVFVKTYDTKGNLTGYQLLSDNFKIDRNIQPEPNGR
jgi:hypothetical protein